MKQTLRVEINKKDCKEYDILLSDDSVENVIDTVNILTKSKKRLFVISKKVYKLYNKILKFPKDEVFVLKDGEKEKNFNNYLKILKKIDELNFTRNDVLIAFGGGVVGDITGFVASTYMRGIDYIQIPTTLLSMVDSSVGGKTAIDFSDAKNIIGTFYQPKTVVININFLNTLDKKQYLSGIGEVLKYAFIENNCNYKHALFLYEYLTLCCEKLLKKEPMTLLRVIEYCLKLKISVVEQDEKETNIRKALNLGHTFGHALETVTKYRKFTHGEAVIYGIKFIFKWAFSQGMIPYSYYRLSNDLLDKYGFNTELDVTKYTTKENFVEIMKKDKKASAEKITFVVPCEKKRVKYVSLTPNEVLGIF